MKLQESGEMYLETILILSERIVNVRSIDIADEMGYSKPSVSRAVNLLKKDGYINIDKNGFLTFTEIGREKAESIYARHKILTKFLRMIGVDEATALADACKMEHTISDKSFEALKAYLKDVEK